ncbi:MAG: DUF167 domain-containing protein [PVC group bacterium]|nr:DUF167 domain-containing protein [PVC group bacterium]
MLINIKVTANAAKNEIIKKSDSEFVVKVTIAPEKGKANKKVIALLSDFLEIKISDISIERGHTSSRKTIRIPDTKRVG